VSARVAQGGLGFSYKWNMGWMHDTLSYLARDPVHRPWHHNDMTFGLLYAFSERFILPLSHDEVVHGKGSLYQKAPGDDWQKLANLRAYFGFMWTHPGKKLLFMGGEFAQKHEWNHDGEIAWYLLQDSSHSGVQRLVRDLNWFYAHEPALHCDAEPQGFRWITAEDASQSVFAYEREAAGAKPIVTVINMTPVPRQAHRIGVSVPGRWQEAINTDSVFYGGSNVGNSGSLETQPVPAHGRNQSLLLTLPPLAALVLQLQS
jgi:1,4-alpha-glucan branching enzyme